MEGYESIDGNLPPAPSRLWEEVLLTPFSDGAFRKRIITMRAKGSRQVKAPTSENPFRTSIWGIQVSFSGPLTDGRIQLFTLRPETSIDHWTLHKSKKASHPPKLVPSDHSKLELLHMDLWGPMRVASINGKKYIFVILVDFSRYTWVYFLHSKDEAPEVIKKFIAQAQLNYKAKVCKIRTDNGTEFKNATLKAHYEKLGIMQQFLTARTP
ncbi:retrovirus-related pol polyprotein from transposon TNT 1-94 [Tanacetum coccineum]